MPDQLMASGAAVTFELETDDLLLRHFLEIGDSFASLLREVSRERFPQTPVRWVVDRISLASPMRLEVRPAANVERLSSDLLSDLSTAVVSGLDQIQRTAQRPNYFSDTALEQAKTLAGDVSTGRSRVRFASRRAQEERIVEVTAQFISHVDEILGQTITAIGSIEGRLEWLNVHGESRVFNVYDHLTGDRIRCEFGSRIPIREVGAAIGLRVGVHGEVFYRESGEIVRVRAHSLEMFPEEEDLPSVDEAKGLLGD